MFRFNSLSPPFLFSRQDAGNYELQLKTIIVFTAEFKTSRGQSQQHMLEVWSNRASCYIFWFRVREAFTRRQEYFKRKLEWKIYKLLQSSFGRVLDTLYIMILVVYGGSARKIALITGHQTLHRLGKNSRVLLFYQLSVTLMNVFRKPSQPNFPTNKPWLICSTESVYKS